MRGYNIDIVPGKRQNDCTNDHTIWKNKQNKWVKTNVEKQIEYIKKSEYASYIKLMKVWRNCQKLELPSINLELSVLYALKDYKYWNSLCDVFHSVLQYFYEKFEGARLEDLGNPSNIVSDNMTNYEKSLVAECAERCLGFVETDRLNSCFQDLW